MSKKFRSSLFGFNRDDVLRYVVEAREADFKNRNTIDELNIQVTNLQESINEISNKLETTTAELESAKAKVMEFEQREEALTRLSESIGRLYLVAQANANAIITSANESVKLSSDAVDQNISVASAAEAELQEISRILNEKTKEYTIEINALKQQITEAKERIFENKAEIANRQSELEVIAAGVE